MEGRKESLTGLRLPSDVGPTLLKDAMFAKRSRGSSVAAKRKVKPGIISCHATAQPNTIPLSQLIRPDQGGPSPLPR